MPKKKVIPPWWKAQERQELALQRIEYEILYGGARGGGKTDAGMAWLLYNIDNPRFRGLVIRKNADDLKDWVDRAEWMYKPTGAKFTGKPVEIEFPSGAKIRENAYQKYQGQEYQRIVIEELTQISEEKSYQQLRASCRSTIDIPARLFATTNPDGPGFYWVKEHWNIPDWPGREPITTNHVVKLPYGGEKILSSVFILSKLQDNPKLYEKDTMYEANLANIKDESLRKAWLEGYWGEPILEGVIYNDEVKSARVEGRITDVAWDPMYPVYTYWDIGRDATPILFMQKIGNWWHLIDFHEESNSNFGHLAEVLRSKPYLYAQHFGPHDLAKTDMTGVTIKQLAENFGIYFTVAPKDSISDGIQAVKMKFARLKIDKTKCAEFIKRISAYRREYDDEKKVFNDTPVHDWASHASDALRYWAVLPEPLLPGELDSDYGLYSQISYK
jgi:hypothetical protein